MMSPLTSQEALTLTANFAFTADRMRASDGLQVRASICETASRVAFLRAHLLSRNEQIIAAFSETSCRPIFAVA